MRKLPKYSFSHQNELKRYFNKLRTMQIYIILNYLSIYLFHCYTVSSSSIYNEKGTPMKKQFLQSMIFCICMGGSTSIFAGEINVGLNDKVISTDFTAPLGQNVNGNIDYLYSDDNGHLAELGLHLTHDASIYHFEIGTQLSRLWVKNSKDATVLSIGGKYAIDLGSNLSLQGSGYYTPTVLTFGDADGHYQFDSQFQYNLTPQMGLYVGYRYIRFKFDDFPSNTFENGAYIGMRAKF